MSNIMSLENGRPIIGRRVHFCQDAEHEWLFPVERFAVGDIVRVKQGERIPLDGVIIKGDVHICEMCLDCKESHISKKHADDVVYSGCINMDGDFDMRVTAVWEDSAYMRQLRHMEQSGQSNGSSFYQKVHDFFYGKMKPVL